MQKTDQTEAMIVLIGTTGTGKSTFILLLTGDDKIRVGHDLESQTSEVNFASYITEQGQHVKLVDTPGFDESHRGVTDTDILERIVKFLFTEGQKLNGLIYMYRISEPRMDDTAKKNLELFNELCGERNFANVRIVTTDWDGVDEIEGETREKELSERYFKHLIDGGAKMFRHDGELESAQSIVSELIQQPPVTLKIQEELNDGRALGDTSAGAVIVREMKEMQKKHEMRMQALKEVMERESKDTRDQLQAERREVLKRIARVQEDSKRLEETRMVRATVPGSLRSRGPNRPQVREPRNRWEQLRALVPVSLGSMLAKRHVKISGILLCLIGVLFFLNRGELYGMYRSWVFGGEISWSGGGGWPDLMGGLTISTGVRLNEQPRWALSPVGGKSTEAPVSHRHTSGDSGRSTVRQTENKPPALEGPGDESLGFDENSPGFRWAFNSA